SLAPSYHTTLLYYPSTSATLLVSCSSLPSLFLHFPATQTPDTCTPLLSSTVIHQSLSYPCCPPLPSIYFPCALSFPCLSLNLCFLVLPFSSISCTSSAVSPINPMSSENNIHQGASLTTPFRSSSKTNMNRYGLRADPRCPPIHTSKLCDAPLTVFTLVLPSLYMSFITSIYLY